MLRKFSFLAIAAVLLLLPQRLIAGGPPWLCLPIDGVTAENRQVCAALFAEELHDKLPPGGRSDRGVEVVEHSGQWYLAMYIGDDVSLAEVEAALKGSDFSVPRDKLRLFGHAILEIDASDASPKQLVADLEALDFVSVEESKGKCDRLLVTLDMPYPAGDDATDRGTVGWDKFQRCDFSSDQATRSEPAATPASLPGLDDFRGVLAKHEATLTGIRWSNYYACRPLGCVAAPDADAAVSLPRSGSRK